MAHKKRNNLSRENCIVKARGWMLNVCDGGFRPANGQRLSNQNGSESIRRRANRASRGGCKLLQAGEFPCTCRRFMSARECALQLGTLPYISILAARAGTRSRIAGLIIIADRFRLIEMQAAF